MNSSDRLEAILDVLGEETAGQRITVETIHAELRTALRLGEDVEGWQISALLAEIVDVGESSRDLRSLAEQLKARLAVERERIVGRWN